MLKKANQKVHVLARITPYMNILKRKLLMNSFFISQFNYCPLVRMCPSRLMNNKINRLHEKFLNIVYSEKTTFEELLDKDGFVTIRAQESYKYFSLKCFKFIRTCRQLLSLRFFALTRIIIT